MATRWKPHGLLTATALIGLAIAGCGDATPPADAPKAGMDGGAMAPKAGMDGGAMAPKAGMDGAPK